MSHLLAVLIGIAGSYLPLALVYKAIDPGLPAALYGPVNFAVNWGLYLSPSSFSSRAWPENVNLVFCCAG